MTDNDTRRPLVLPADDDSSDHLELLLRTLDREDDAFCCVVAKSVAQTRERLSRRLTGLLLADCSVPDGDGGEIPEETAGRVSVATLSSHGDERIIRDIFRAGAFGYVAKSPGFFALMPRIARWVLREWGNRAARQRAEAAFLEALP